MTDRYRVGANLATLANGLLGVGAVLYTLAGNKLWAMLLVACAIGFDGLDGLLSRRSRLPTGAFGRVADSIADALSFGVAPAVMLAVHTTHEGLWAPYAAATTAIAAAYLAAAVARLTYFTARAHGLPHFRGVPTPESALAVIVLLLFHDTPGYAGVAPVGAIVGAAIVAVLMLAPVPYPKVRRGSAMQLPSAITAGLAALVLVPLQFRPPAGSPLAGTAELAAYGLLAGVALYYVYGPFTVRHAAAGGS
ncbi:MAG TPA: CDP-alcohol phosphatidyltransferase family protein [Thermoplasmata archaeon]|nr:CDP-alcohol phosphatidyltransferase family protein [Thermoplasmata archaeon]